MKERVIRWLELDKIQLEYPKKMLTKFLKMSPVLAGSVFLYIALTTIGKGYDSHSVIGQVLGTVPVLCYCIWVLALLIIILRQVKEASE